MNTNTTNLLAPYGLSILECLIMTPAQISGYFQLENLQQMFAVDDDFEDRFEAASAAHAINQSVQWIGCDPEFISRGIMAELERRYRIGDPIISVELVATYQRDPDRADSAAYEYMLVDQKGYEWFVLATNGDPVWKDADELAYQGALEWYQGTDDTDDLPVEVMDLGEEDDIDYIADDDIEVDYQGADDLPAEGMEMTSETIQTGYGDTIHIVGTRGGWYQVYATRDAELVGDDGKRTYWFCADDLSDLPTAGLYYHRTTDDPRRIPAVARWEVEGLVEALREALKPLA